MPASWRSFATVAWREAQTIRPEVSPNSFFCRAFSWEEAPNSEKGFDATDGQGKRYQIAAETGYRLDTLEKVLRLLKLLDEIAQDPVLSQRLALKGGTAFNVFYLDLDRLSVDIALNYVGALDLTAIGRKRPSWNHEHQVSPDSLSSTTSHPKHAATTSRGSA